ncbi:hypothetical protein [Bacillus sp. FJAT-47783]|uniref:hypothetical protein n=1 Tax=Bacillus sp. FJAT-47783 TaxID=2922712 RepID=UPI001FADCC8F|nr:hypothetical protein [Bacillus sp. FJAT-47783]
MIIRIFKNLVLHYFTLLRRRKTVLITLILLTFYIVFSHSQHMTYDFFHPGSALTLSSPIIQIGMFIFGILGVSFNLEEKNFLYDKSGRTNNTSLTLVSKLTFALVFSIFLSIIFTLLFWIILLLNSVPLSNFYYESARYIFYYWCIPFFVMFCIGTIFGEILNNVFSYFFTIIFAILLGPLNFLFIFKGLDQIGIGQRENSTFYHPLYGYPLETTVLLKQFCTVLLTLLFLFLIYLLKRNYNKKFLIITSFLMVTSVVLISLFFKYENIEQKLVMETKNKNIFNEILYYEKELNNYKQLIDKKIDIKANNYEIVVDMTNKHINIETKIAFKNPHREKLVLNLYHGFKINKLKLNNKDVSFTRKGDYIYINSQGEGEIYLKYNGRSSPLFFANNQAILLPAYFSWIPSFNLTPAFSFYDNQLLRNYSQNNYTANYNLIYKGPLEVYSNLNKLSNKTFSGQSSNGVFLIAGQLTKVKYSNDEIVLPNTWLKAMKRYNEFKILINNIINETSKILNQPISSPNKVFIIPITGMNDSLMEQNIWLFNDHLVINFPTYKSFNRDALISEEYLINSVVPAIAWKNHSSFEENFTKQELFNATLSHWIAVQNNANNNYFSFILDKYLLYYPDKEEIIESIEILKRINFENVKKPSRFQLWYKAIKEDKEWVEINKIIRGFTNDKNRKLDQKEAK